MRNPILICLALSVVVFISGCVISDEKVERFNQEIQDRYNSFSTLEYTITEISYVDNEQVQKQVYTEIFKKPDKIRQGFDVSAGSNAQNLLYICNENTAYSQITLDIINVYDYVNLPPEMVTYCNYFIEKLPGKWQIPQEITDVTKYRVEFSREDYGGKPAIKAVVTILMSEEAKQKQFAIGKVPKESVATYWFDDDTFAILKEEYIGYGTSCGTEPNCNDFELRTERLYEGFYFDVEIPDSIFEIIPSDYPGVEFIEETVDIQEKFGYGNFYQVTYQDFDLQCMGFGGAREFVARTQAEYQHFINTSPDLYPNPYLPCVDYEFPVIDFSQKTLLGRTVNGGGCSYDVVKGVLRNDSERMVIYSIATTFTGTCGKAITDNNFILVPKIPEDYTVKFEVISS